ncbi:MAG TPA: cupredoxin domain-containing protein [Acidimicrobiales bacterium]|nr:cupredoxin domain-containing protein [Acidimicrobiales bacterium]
MINNAAKFALGLSVAGLVAAVVATDDKAAGILLLGLFLSAATIALGVGRSAGADLPPRGEPGASSPIDPADNPRPSYGPLITALAGFVLVLGGALGSSYVLASVVVAAVGAAVWLYDSFKPLVAVRDARNVDQRLLGPLAMPVFGFLTAITVAYSLSRVLLAVNETASWLVALVVASVLLLVLAVIAERVPTTKVVASMAGVGLLAVLVAGGAGAGAGEREFHAHEEETPVIDILAKDVAFDRKVIGLPADTTVEMVFTNLDVDTFHNVGIYTNEEPGGPVFSGKPIAKGSAVYRFRTPGAGTYRYVCDFHPTMVGELRLEESTEHMAEGTRE